MEKLLKVEQVADLLQVSPSLVYKWVHYGYIPHVKIGSLLRFREPELTRWLYKKRHKGRASLTLPIG
jgi:excisionase family DNA binding protein